MLSVAKQSGLRVYVAFVDILGDFAEANPELQPQPPDFGCQPLSSEEEIFETFSTSRVLQRELRMGTKFTQSNRKKTWQHLKVHIAIYAVML
jgi:hypothetical protein